MKRFILFIALSCAVLLGAQAGGNILSLEQARELALQNNSDYQAKLAELNAAKWGKYSAGSKFLPTLSLDGTWLYMDPATTYQAGGQTNTLNQDIRSFGFSLSQPLFLGGKLWQAYKMSQISEEMAQTSLDGQKLTLLTDVNNLYLSLLQTQSLLGMSELDEQSAVKNLEIAQLKFDNGLLSTADYLKFKSRLASKEVALLQTQTALQLAQLNLRNYLGLDYLPRAQELPDLENDSGLLTLDTYDTRATTALTALALEQSRTGNTSLKLLENSVELSRRAYQLSKGSFLPTLMLIGSRQYDENGIDRYQFTASNQIMLTASIPILPQLGNYAELRKADFNHQKAILQARTANNGILLGTEASVLNLVSAAKQVRAAKLALDYTQQSYEQLQERFRMNMISSTELLDAELMLSSARIAYSNAVYAYHKARIALMQAMGWEDAQALNELIIIGVNK